VAAEEHLARFTGGFFDRKTGAGELHIYLNPLITHATTYPKTSKATGGPSAFKGVCIS
jgi:hypothetical protein